MISEYLSTPQLLHCLYGLNHRFNRLVYRSVRHFIISQDDAVDISDPYAKDIENLIEKVSCDVQHLGYLLPSLSALINLRTLVLRCCNTATVELIVERASVKQAIQSCLNILRTCDVLSDDQFSREDMLVSPCPHLVRLLVEECSEEALLLICALAPNLHYLKVKQVIPNDESTNIHPSFELLKPISSLKQLHVAATTKRLNDMTLIGRIIESCQSSIEQISLEIALNDPTDGYSLQKVLQPCEHLQKFTLAFSCWLDDDDDDHFDLVPSFQTDWWLDSHRPPIVIFRSNHCETFIVSMPCPLDTYAWFPIDPSDWLINKGHLDSNDVHFTKQRSIRLGSQNPRQSISFDSVNLLGHLFHAPNQTLSIPHYEFITPDPLIEQVSYFSDSSLTVE